MSLTKWKDAVEVTGIVAIVGSLVFVGFQLQQAEESLRIQFHQGELAAFQEQQGRISENKDLAEAIALARNDPDSMSPTQKIQVIAWLEEWLGVMSTWRNLRDAGALSEADLERRYRNSCYIYNAYPDLLKEIHEYTHWGVFLWFEQNCNN